MAAFLVWLVVWRLPFAWMERIFGLGGLALLVFAVTVFKFGPDWGALLHDATHPQIPSQETPFTYAYFAIALFGAAMTPYEVFFFSSGAVEDGWTERDLAVNRANVYIGFPLGGLLTLALMASASLVLAPVDIDVGELSQVVLPAAVVVGKLGLAAAILGVFAATFGAALETALSAGYTISQYFGWTWGKHVRPQEAARFHLVVLLAIAGAALFALSGVDPVKVTEYSIVLSAAALPLTYLPILVIANDPKYMGERVNGWVLNAIGSVYLVVLVLVSVATIPLIIITKGGGVMASTSEPAARVLWAGLDLLDRQLVDRQGRMCGNVDDLELSSPDAEGRVFVDAIHTGPGALLLRMQRRTLGRWLQRAHDARPVPIANVADIGVHLTLSLEEEEIATFATERWVRDHVIGHIPGARDAPR